MHLKSISLEEHIEVEDNNEIKDFIKISLIVILGAVLTIVIVFLGK